MDHKHHPVLQYLPTKLAEWIGENMQDKLGFPDKLDPNKWGISELNNILQKHVVPDLNGCALHTFGCLEWESELYRGIMRASCVTPSKCQSVGSQCEPSGTLQCMIPGWFQPAPGISHSEVIYTMVIPYLSLTYSIGQDTVLIVPPYPNFLEDPSDVPLADCWITHPQLYFSCHLRPENGRQPNPVTRMGRTTSQLNWYSSAPVRNWPCQVLWRARVLELSLIHI